MKEDESVNKQELINAVAEKAGLSKKDTEAAVNAVIDTITDALVKGDTVKIVGFGNFEVKTRAARQGRNPRTNEVIEIPTCKAPVFKAAKVLKDSVN